MNGMGERWRDERSPFRGRQPRGTRKRRLGVMVQFSQTLEQALEFRGNHLDCKAARKAEG
jgi:hypothetical protein